MVNTAICTKCQIEKPLTEFYPRNTKAGYRKDCKECTNAVKSKLWKAGCGGNKCKRCDSPRLRGSRVCLYHCIKNICIHSDINTEHIDNLILKLKEQEFKCFYTGKLLLPGDNLSIDHKIPRSKGGTDSLENLVWVDIAVNRIKNNVDLEEFLIESSPLLEEIKFLSSLETPEQKQVRLSYVLGNYS